MDLDQLKLILDTIQAMGGDAKEFGIWYLVAAVVPKIINTVGFSIVFYIAIKTVQRIIASVCKHASADSQASRIAHACAFEITSILGLGITPDWTLTERQQVVNEIQRLKDLEREYEKEKKTQRP